jgi:hypothetical protein
MSETNDEGISLSASDNPGGLPAELPNRPGWLTRQLDRPKWKDWRERRIAEKESFRKNRDAARDCGSSVLENNRKALYSKIKQLNRQMRLESLTELPNRPERLTRQLDRPEWKDWRERHIAERESFRKNRERRNKYSISVLEHNRKFLQKNI